MVNLPLRPSFIRSSLILGWIAGGAFALLAARSLPPPPAMQSLPAANPPVEVEVARVPEADRDEMSHDQMLTLQLDITSSNTACTYFSSFDVGDVELPKGTRGATLEREFDFTDGCHWRAEETLVRVEDGRYSYSYRERPLSCRPNTHAAAPCVRSGYAVVQTDDDGT